MNAAIQGKDRKGQKGADQTWNKRDHEEQEGRPDFRLEPQRDGHYLHSRRSCYWNHSHGLPRDVSRAMEIAARAQGRGDLAGADRGHGCFLEGTEGPRQACLRSCRGN